MNQPTYQQTNQTHEKHLAESLAANRSLTELFLNDNQIGDEGVQILCKNLAGHSLRVLNLSVNPISTRGAFYLAEMCLAKGCELKTLCLGGAMMPKTSFSGGNIEEELKAAEALKKTEAAMAGGGGNGGGGGGGESPNAPKKPPPPAAGGPGAPQQQKKKKFGADAADDWDNKIKRIGPEGASCLAAALLCPHACPLQKLWLVNCDIGAEG